MEESGAKNNIIKGTHPAAYNFFRMIQQAEHNLCIYKLFIYFLPHNFPLLCSTGKIIYKNTCFIISLLQIITH